MLFIIVIHKQKLILKDLYFEPRPSKFQSFNKFPNIFDSSDTDTISDSSTSFGNQSSFSPHFN